MLIEHILTNCESTVKAKQFSNNNAPQQLIEYNTHNGIDLLKDDDLNINANKRNKMISNRLRSFGYTNKNSSVSHDSIIEEQIESPKIMTGLYKIKVDELKK